MENKIKELEEWAECLQRAVKYSEEHDLKDETYYHIRESLARVRGRIFYLKNLEEKNNEKTK